jgi:GntR family transcriptional regulator
MPPRYQRVADALRELIINGSLPPGATVPSADTLAHQHDVGRDTALKGLSVLRREGLLFLAPDRTIRVGPVAARSTRLDPGGPDEILEVPADSVVWARMPTPDERSRFDLPLGVPVLIVRTGSGEQVHAADRHGLRFARRTQ